MLKNILLAFNISNIVSGTLSCNLSSTAVAPIKNRSLSILSARFLISSSLFFDSAKELIYSLKSLYSFSLITFIAIIKVLNPITLNLDK